MAFLEKSCHLEALTGIVNAVPRFIYRQAAFSPRG